MNALESQSLENDIRRSTAKQDLARMVDTLEESIRILRGHLAQGVDSFEKNKDAIEQEVIASKVIMTQMTRRLDQINHSINMVINHYEPIGVEIEGVRANEESSE